MVTVNPILGEKYKHPSPCERAPYRSGRSECPGPSALRAFAGYLSGIALASGPPLHASSAEPLPVCPSTGLRDVNTSPFSLR